MYNNAIIQTNYKPYIPLPKKKTGSFAAEEKKSSGQSTTTVTPNNYSNTNGQKQKSSSDTFTASSYKSTTINIKQILIDFHSTLNAIGASEEVEEEVKTYLSLVETQAKKENPNKKMIISDLKIAADVLDEYISTSLNKPSKVVKDWVDALLLQKIDFKSDESITKGAFESITGEKSQTAKVAEKRLAKKETELQTQSFTGNVETTNSQEVQNAEGKVQVSQQNERIDELISKAKEESKLSPKDALKSLSEAFTLAQQDENKPAIAEIYYQIATIQNSENNLAQALDCLHASTVLAYTLDDNRLKTQTHKEMGKIYDDAGLTDVAISHYFISLSLDGELDDTDNQADTLTSIGKIHTSKYEKDEAVDYYKDALELAKVKQNLPVMEDIFYNTATTYRNAGQSESAMKNYRQAAILSQKSGDSAKLCAIYEQAADLMESMNFGNRATDLYKKSYRIAEKLDDKNSVLRIREKIKSVR